MEHFIEKFLKEKERQSGLVHENNMQSTDITIKALESELYDYVFKLHLYSYIKKTIIFSAMQIKKKATNIINKEMLVLNAKDINSNEERINLIPDVEIDFLERVCKDTIYSEISQNKHIVDAINTLTDKQKIILYYCILQGESDTYVAKRLSITKQGVNKSKIAGINKLRKYLEKVYRQAI